MKNQSIIEKAISKIESKSGYSYSHAKVSEAVESGLQDGDNIYLGENSGKEARCKVVGDTAQMVLGDKVMTELKLTDLNDDQVASILSDKAAAAGRTGQSMGTPKF